MECAKKGDMTTYQHGILSVCQYLCTEVEGCIHDFTVFNGKVGEQAVSVFTEENVELLAVWIHDG